MVNSIVAGKTVAGQPSLFTGMFVFYTMQMGRQEMT